jgi:uncharacterized membrane protein
MIIYNWSPVIEGCLMVYDYLGLIKKHSIGITVWVILIATAVAVFWLRDTNPNLILPVVGVASFAVPIVLSFSDKYNLGTRLDNGELRKSIAISLTVIYIIMLSLFFINMTLSPLPQDSASHDTKTVNDKKIENATQAFEKNKTPIIDTAKTSLTLPFLIGSASAEEPQETTTENEDKPKENPDAKAEEDKDLVKDPSDDLEEGVEKPATDKDENTTSLQSIPEKAIENIYINFLYVYILIIGFYFGSRVFEDFAGVRMAKELKDVDPVDLLKRRYATGEISEEDYTNKIDNLGEPEDLLRSKLARSSITEDEFERKIKRLDEPAILAFSFDKGKNTIRITNISDKEIVISDLLVDGIHAFDKDGKPLKGKTIGAKKHTDINITVQGLREDKDKYFIRLTTESGKAMKEAVIPSEL